MGEGISTVILCVCQDFDTISTILQYTSTQGQTLEYSQERREPLIGTNAVSRILEKETLIKDANVLRLSSMLICFLWCLQWVCTSMYSTCTVYVYYIFGGVLQVIYDIHTVVNFQRFAGCGCNQAGRGVCW